MPVVTSLLTMELHPTQKFDRSSGKSTQMSSQCMMLWLFELQMGVPVRQITHLARRANWRPHAVLCVFKDVSLWTSSTTKKQRDAKEARFGSWRKWSWSMKLTRWSSGVMSLPHLYSLRPVKLPGFDDDERGSSNVTGHPTSLTSWETESNADLGLCWNERMW